MKPANDTRCDFCAIIRHPDESRILVIDEGCDGQILPHWVDRRIRWQAANHVIPMVQRELGIETRMLRCLCFGLNPDRRRPALAYEMTTRQGVWATLPNVHWIRQEDLRDTLIPEAFRECGLESQPGP